MNLCKIFSILSLTLLLSACSGDRYVTFSGYAQGGTYNVKINMAGVRTPQDEIAATIDSLLTDIDFSISGYNHNSLLSRRNAGEDIVPDGHFAALLDISEKYNRGRHTTNHSLYIEGDGFSIIDTPGVREIEVPFEDLQKVSEAFPELPSGECLYDGCLHQGEDGCIVPELVEKGLVDENRYESYLRIIDALRDRKPAYMRNRKSRG